jgi:hypothetical protein
MDSFRLFRLNLTFAHSRHDAESFNELINGKAIVNGGATFQERRSAANSL